MDTFLKFVSDFWRAGLEVLILSVLIYSAYRFFRSTRGAHVLTGLLLILVSLTLLSEALQLEVIGWLIKSFSVFLAITLVVIFQPELRRALAELGSQPIFSFGGQKREIVEDLYDSILALSNRKFGALLAVERGLELKSHAETGVSLDCKFSTELLLTIFHPNTALHDGGMILHNDRIIAAACVFPVSQREMSDRSVGLRHRAGLGITEESDAVVIIVSEETGHISLAHRGKLERQIDKDTLKQRLNELLVLKIDLEDETTPSPELEDKTDLPSSRHRDLVSY